MDNKNNTGTENTGYRNSGNRNSGNGNSGNGNSGYRNSGYRNSGNGNSGNGNSGYRNSGYGNSGYGNSGYGNSGNGNSGYGNSGYRNSGNGNSGYGNSCNRSSGIFCTKAPQPYLFNKPSDKTWEEINHPYFENFYLNKWISESEMTDKEKLEQTDFHVRGGYLKTYSWEDAWANYWRDSDQEERDRVLNLPNFDAEIFKEITGIDVSKSEEKVPTTVQVIVNGKSYEYKLEGEK